MNTTRPDGAQQLSSAILTSSDIDALAKANVAPGDILPTLKRKMPELSGAIDIFVESGRHSDGEIWRFAKSLVVDREKNLRRAAEAKAIIAALVAAGASPEAIAAVAATIIDGRDAEAAMISAKAAPLSSTERSRRHRAKRKAAAEEGAARNAECNAAVACNVASVASLSSVSSLSSSKIDDDDDDDGDARARGQRLKVLAEQTATQVERIVQAAGKMRSMDPR
jgi:hypothetical protein